MRLKKFLRLYMRYSKKHCTINGKQVSALVMAWKNT